ncbi:MAG: glycosyltransferase, partial [Candidatus Omnitrophica bacterium]|nr:glycosyltransferase [Candidatus Omnitrophota bacterium]
MEVLYISYDGMLEPLGQSQVVNTLTRLAGRHSISLLSFEKGSDLIDSGRLKECARQMREAGIHWIRLRYHKRPLFLAKGWDLLQGIAAGAFACRGRRVRLVHARGYLASAIALALKRMFHLKFLFDMRGFWPEEKVGAGHWTDRDWMYRAAKGWEQRFFEKADAIVSLTRAGVRVFPALGYSIPSTTIIEVIPTCVDLERFCPGPRDQRLGKALGMNGGPVLGCVGNLSGWYLRDETLRCMAFLMERLEGSQALFVTREDHPLLRSDAIRAGIPSRRLRIVGVHFSEMPEHLRWMDLGVFFIRADFSKKGSAATKLGEFLATGVPVVINAGVGDSDRIVREEDAGVLLQDLSREDFEGSLGKVKGLLNDPACPARCRAAAQRYF